MKLVRPAVAAALGAGLVLAGTAGAVTKPVCNLVTDASGDATGFVVTSSPLPNDATLDILSADVATNAKNFAGIIRLAAVGKDSTSMQDTYYLNFSANGTKYFVSANYDGTTATFTAGDFSGTPAGSRHSIGSISGKVDAASKTVSFSAPLSTWGLKGTSAISGFDVLAQRYLGGAGRGVTPTADEAISDKTYKGSTPSCLKP